jgi:7,8-dihydropterin-6-yl-methyl-4-(beta-D-ribofuranosyl)aminobenzene 5'-phosphate synthase
MTAGLEIRKHILPADINDLMITILYDNNSFQKGLKVDWGFSCFIEGLDQPILFDTGRYDTMFISNLDALGIDAQKTALVFLSHEHPDHIGGLSAFLDRKTGIEVYMVDSFSSSVKKTVNKKGAQVVGVSDPMMVTRNCFSTGEMPSFAKNEHSLIIHTTAGLVVITGCAHPGVADIVEKAQKMMDQEVLLVLGGFHLLYDTDSRIQKIVERFKSMGVRHVAPTHCSGTIAQNIFKKGFKGNYLNCGVGRVLSATDLSLENTA